MKLFLDHEGYIMFELFLMGINLSFELGGSSFQYCDGCLEFLGLFRNGRLKLLSELSTDCLLEGFKFVFDVIDGFFHLGFELLKIAWRFGSGLRCQG